MTRNEVHVLSGKVDGTQTTTTRRKHMDTQIVAVFCLVDDILKAMRHREDEQCQMSDAEVMTTAIIAALYFGGNYSLGDCIASNLSF